jgi:hypothetical protein
MVIFRMTLAAQTFADVPVAELAPMILAFGVGVVLCFFGRRVMRLAFMGAGLLAGAAAGWIITQSIELPVSGWIVIIGLGVVLAVVAALAYKITVAVVMAVVLGALCPLALVTAGEAGLYELPSSESSPDADDEDDAVAPEHDAESESDALPGLGELDLPPDIEDWLNDVLKNAAAEKVNGAVSDLLGEDAAGETDDESDVADAGANASKLTLPPEAQEHVDRAKVYVEDAYAGAKERWDGYPQSLRNNLLLSAAIGALLGLLLGALATNFSASIASAGAGSAICLFAASVCVARLGYAEANWMPNNSTVWLALWTVLAIIGLTIQWTLRPKPVDKAG